MARRDPASSYAKIVKPKDRPIQKQPPVTPEERLRWALARFRAAQFKARLHPDDRVLALAADARQQEYLDLRFRIEGR